MYMWPESKRSIALFPKILLKKKSISQSNE